MTLWLSCTRGFLHPPPRPFVLFQKAEGDWGGGALDIMHGCSHLMEGEGKGTHFLLAIVALVI